MVYTRVPNLPPNWFTGNTGKFWGFTGITGTVNGKNPPVNPSISYVVICRIGVLIYGREYYTLNGSKWAQKYVQKCLDLFLKYKTDFDKTSTW